MCQPTDLYLKWHPQPPEPSTSESEKGRQEGGQEAWESRVARLGLESTLETGQSRSGLDQAKRGGHQILTQ
jgi:hypothetical protein